MVTYYTKYVTTTFMHTHTSVLSHYQFPKRPIHSPHPKSPKLTIHPIAPAFPTSPLRPPQVITRALFVRPPAAARRAKRAGSKLYKVVHPDSDNLASSAPGGARRSRDRINIPRTTGAGTRDAPAGTFKDAREKESATRPAPHRPPVPEP